MSPCATALDAFNQTVTTVGAAINTTALAAVFSDNVTLSLNGVSMLAGNASVTASFLANATAVFELLTMTCQANATGWIVNNASVLIDSAASWRSALATGEVLRVAVSLAVAHKERNTTCTFAAVADVVDVRCRDEQSLIDTVSLYANPQHVCEHVNLCSPDDRVAMILIAVVNAFSAGVLLVAAVLWLVDCGKVKVASPATSGAQVQSSSELAIDGSNDSDADPDAATRDSSMQRSPDDNASNLGEASGLLPKPKQSVVGRDERESERHWVIRCRFAGRKKDWLCWMPLLSLLLGLVAEVWRCALASIDAQDGSIDWSLSAYLFDIPGILLFVSVAAFKFCLTEQEAGDDHTRTLLRTFQAMSSAVLTVVMICGVAVGSSTTSVADPDEKVRSLWVLLMFGVAYLLLSLHVFASAYNLLRFNHKGFSDLLDKPKLLHKCGSLLINVILGVCLVIRGAMCLALAILGVLTANPPHFKSTASSAIDTGRLELRTT